MPVSRLSPTGSGRGLTDSAAHVETDARAAVPASATGQGLADLLVLGAFACQTPVAVLSVPQPGGGWSSLCQGFEERVGLNDNVLYDALCSAHGPVEFTDMVTSLPRSPLVQPPHSMRWAYGVALRDASGSVMGVVAVMDRWLRQLTKREQRAMAALAREVATHLSVLRRPAEAPDSAPVFRQGPKTGASSGRSGRSSSATTETPQLLRSHEVATIFDVTERTVINWAAAGKLPSLRTIGGHLRFRRDDVMRLLSGATELAD